MTAITELDAPGKKNKLQGIKKLRIGSNYDEAMRDPGTTTAVCAALGSKTLQGLEAFDIADNSLGVKGAVKLAEALEKTALPITELLLSSTLLGYQGGEKVAAACSKLLKLRRIDFFSCHIGDKAAEKIGEVMAAGNVPFSTIGLQSNAISEDGASIIAQGLNGVADSLENLDLSSNAIGNNRDTACAAFAAAFKANPLKKLRVLNLAENTLGSANPGEFIKAMGYCKALAWLDLSSNSLKSDIGDSLVAALKELTNLRVLCLNDNADLGDDISVQMFEAATSMTKLEELHASKIGLADKGVDAATKMLKENGSRLVAFDLRGNVVSKDKCEQLRDAAGSQKSALLLPDGERGTEVSGPLDARKMHYEYHGTKRFIQ